MHEPIPRTVKPCGRRGCRCRGRRMLDGFVGNGVGLPGARMDVQAADFVVVEGARYRAWSSS